MSTYHLSQVPADYHGMSFVSNSTGTLTYYITGATGHKGDQLTINAANGQPLAYIKQTSPALLPRFKIYINNFKISSFGLYFHQHELVYLTNLQWLITGSLKTRRFTLIKGRDILARAYPEQDGRLTIDLLEDQQAALICLLVAFLDRWRLVHPSQPSLAVKSLPLNTNPST